MGIYEYSSDKVTQGSEKKSWGRWFLDGAAGLAKTAVSERGLRSSVEVLAQLASSGEGVGTQLSLLAEAHESRSRQRGIDIRAVAGGEGGVAGGEGGGGGEGGEGGGGGGGGGVDEAERERDAEARRAQARAAVEAIERLKDYALMAKEAQSYSLIARETTKSALSVVKQFTVEESVEGERPPGWKEAMKWINDARVNFLSGRYADALIGFGQGISYFMNHEQNKLAAQACFWRAQVYFYMNNISKSMHDFSFVLSVNPESDQAKIWVSILRSVLNERNGLARVTATSEITPSVARLIRRILFYSVLPDPSLQDSLVESDLSFRCSDEKNLLHIASCFSTVTICSLLVEKRSDLLNDKDQSGDTPLHTAIRSGRLDVCEYFVRVGRPNLFREKNRQNYTPLQLAQVLGNTAIVRELNKRSRAEDYKFSDEELRDLPPALARYGIFSPSAVERYPAKFYLPAMPNLVIVEIDDASEDLRSAAAPT